MSTPPPSNSTWATWDFLVLDGTLFDVPVELDGEAIKRKIDSRSAAGRDGATIRDKGFDVVDFTTTFRAWTRDHFGALDVLLSMVSPRAVDPQRRTLVHTMEHPALAQVGITRVYFKGAALLKRVSTGLYEQRFTWLEYNPPPARNVTRAPQPSSSVARATALDPNAPTTIRPIPGVSITPIPPPSQTATGPRR